MTRNASNTSHDPVAHFAQFLAEQMESLPSLAGCDVSVAEALAQKLLHGCRFPSFQEAWVAVHQGERELAYIARAQEQSAEGEIEVDDDALVSEGCDDGAYVQAWIWVSATDAGLEPLDSESDG